MTPSEASVAARRARDTLIREHMKSAGTAFSRAWWGYAADLSGLAWYDVAMPAGAGAGLTDQQRRRLVLLYRRRGWLTRDAARTEWNRPD